jgi:hypothetical protein
MTPRRVGLKYCGGCQPRYDRTAAVARLARRLAGRAVLVPWDDPLAEAVLVVCGCDVSCADVAAIDKPLVWVASDVQADAITWKEIP